MCSQTVSLTHLSSSNAETTPHVPQWPKNHPRHRNPPHLFSPQANTGKRKDERCTAVDGLLTGQVPERDAWRTPQNVPLAKPVTPSPSIRASAGQRLHKGSYPEKATCGRCVIKIMPHPYWEYHTTTKKTHHKRLLTLE